VTDSYTLEIESVTPYWRDVTRIKSSDLSDFEPEHVDRGGVMYERYASDDGGWIEIRLDYIVMRRVLKDEDDAQETRAQGRGVFATIVHTPKDSTT